MTDSSSPFRESALWKGMDKAMQRDWGRYPTRLHYLADIFFSPRGPHEWMNGRLIDTGDAEADIAEHTEHDLPYKPPAADANAPLPALYAVIPSFCDADFLVRNAGAHRAAQDELPVPVSRHCPVTSLPRNVEAYHLAAGLTLLKHLHEHPGRLPPRDRDGQRRIVAASLRAGLTLARERGLEDALASACGHIAAQADALCAFPQKYLQEQERLRNCEKTARSAFASLSPTGQEKLLEKLREIFGEVTGAGQAEPRPYAPRGTILPPPMPKGS